MTEYLADFGRRIGSKDKQQRKRIIYVAQLAVGGTIGVGLVGYSLLENNRVNKANKFLQTLTPGVTKGQVYDTFVTLPKWSKKMAIKAIKNNKNVVLDANNNPINMPKEFKRDLKSVYLEKSGLKDDLMRDANKLNAAKKQSTTGDIAKQKAFGEKVLSKIRTKVKSQGDALKKGRLETLGFSNSNLFLIDF